jgi:Ca-activated chloride channel homolog
MPAIDIDAAKDYYGILGVAINATADEIRAAYRNLAKRYHPDTGHKDVEQFRRVQEAHDVLWDPALRRAYDKQRALRGAGMSPLSLTVLQSRDEMPPMGAAQMLYLLLEMRPREGLRGPRKRLNLALVIDRSTSMQGVRMHNVKLAAADLIDSLQPEDRLALITFSDRADVVASAQSASEKRSLRSALAAINVGGGTEIHQGLVAGIHEIMPYASSDSIAHVILLTDGRTYGDEALAMDAASRANARGIGISTFGIGEDWHDIFLDGLAQRGGGTSQYIDTPSKVQDVLRSQIEGLNSTVLSGVRIHVGAAPYVTLKAAYRATPYMQILPIDNGHAFTLGDLHADEVSTTVMELTVMQEETGQRRIARLAIEGRSSTMTEPVQLWRDINVTFTQKSTEKPVSPRLLNVLARLSVFRLQEEAWLALEGGDTEQATRYLESAATHLFDLGYHELGRAAMLEVTRISRGSDPTVKGRKQLRYGTRALSIPSS